MWLVEKQLSLVPAERVMFVHFCGLHCQVTKVKQFSNEFNVLIHKKIIHGLESTVHHEQGTKLADGFCTRATFIEH